MPLTWTKTAAGHAATAPHGTYEISRTPGHRFAVAFGGFPLPGAADTLARVKARAETHAATFTPPPAPGHGPDDDDDADTVAEPTPVVTPAAPDPADPPGDPVGETVLGPLVRPPLPTRADGSPVVSWLGF